MRRVVLYIGGAVIAGIAMFATTGSGPKASPAPAASLPGTPLVESTARAVPRASGGAAAEDTRAVNDPEPAWAVNSLKPSTPAAMPELQLDKLERVGDHYEAPLADGRRAVLTLDPDLQETAEQLLAEARAPRGAIVAMAPDGRILALAGRRTEEPKGGKKGTPDWHLATDVWAPAASVFKLVTASALVQAGVDPDEKIPYHGGIRSVSESNLRDDKRDNASANLVWGVAHSNNAVVGKLAYQHLEPTALDKLAHDLTTLPAFAVPATAAELALPQDKSLAFAQAAAGFSGSRLSVLGGALLAATFADGGNQPAPRLVDKIADAPLPATASHRVLAENIARSVARMMVATCDIGSAARSFRHGKATVAGKTGTLTTTSPFYMEHSWFVGFAPADKPAIIVSVLLGNPESWHLRGHEAARRLIDRAIRDGADHAPARAPHVR